MDRYPRDRLILALRLLELLPSRPILCRDDILADLEIPRKRFARLLHDIRQSGIPIEVAVMPDGRRAYFLGERGRAFIRRLVEG